MIKGLRVEKKELKTDIIIRGEAISSRVINPSYENF